MEDFGSSGGATDAADVRALSVTDGSVIWENQYAGEQLRGIELLNAQLVVGFGNTLRLMDATTGTVTSEVDLDSWSPNGFVRTEDQLYTVDTKIRAHDPNTGNQIWSIERDREPDTPSITSSNRLYSGTNPGYLTAHDLETLSKLWEVEIDHNIVTRPAASQSVVFVNDSLGNYSAIDKQTGEVVYTDQQSAEQISIAAVDDFVSISVLTPNDSFAQGFEIGST